MVQMEHFDERLRSIEERNLRVEADKAWETSWTRRTLLMLFTYLAVGLYLAAIDVPRPWINAIVPSVGFTPLQPEVHLFKMDRKAESERLDGSVGL